MFLARKRESKAKRQSGSQSREREARFKELFTHFDKYGEYMYKSTTRVAIFTCRLPDQLASTGFTIERDASRQTLGKQELAAVFDLSLQESKASSCCLPCRSIYLDCVL